MHACMHACPIFNDAVPMQGIVGAACGAGFIIGTYFAFYSTTKKFLKENTDLKEGEGEAAVCALHLAGMSRS